MLHQASSLTSRDGDLDSSRVQVAVLGNNYIQGNRMAQMKNLLLEAVIAMNKVIDAGGTVEDILELADYIADGNTNERETR